jgi:hypothetical protein
MNAEKRAYLDTSALVALHLTVMADAALSMGMQVARF